MGNQLIPRLPVALGQAAQVFFLLLPRQRLGKLRPSRHIPQEKQAFLQQHQHWQHAHPSLKKGMSHPLKKGLPQKRGTETASAMLSVSLPSQWMRDHHSPGARLVCVGLIACCAHSSFPFLAKKAPKCAAHPQPILSCLEKKPGRRLRCRGERRILSIKGGAHGSPLTTAPYKYTGGIRHETTSGLFLCQGRQPCL